MAKAIKEKEVIQPKEEVKVEPIEKVEVVKEETPVEKPKVKEPEIELTEEEKIMKYVEDSHSPTVEINPLLRSLYPVVTPFAPAQYLLQTESKRLKGVLSKMVSENKIRLVDNTYLKLGQFYYMDGETRTQYYNINSLKIIATK